MVVTIEEPKLPYRIKPVWAEPEVASVISVTLSEHVRSNFDLRHKLGTRHLFTVVGGDLIFTSDSRGRNEISVIHPWAGDVEGDTCRYALLELESVAPKHGWTGHQTWSAWLVGVQFYADPATDPFVGVQERKTPEEGEPDYGPRYLNSGFPFTPPYVRVKGLTLPVMVDIDINLGAGVRWMEWVQKHYLSEEG